jgi:hypothetical protein
MSFVARENDPGWVYLRQKPELALQVRRGEEERREKERWG